MSRRSAPLFIGTQRFVAAISPQTGEEQWRTRLPSGMGMIVALWLGPDRLYAGHAGHIHALDPRTGALLWTNDLPKMQYYAVLPVAGGVPNVDLSAAAGDSDRLYIGTSRHVAAIEPASGEEIWRTKLPRMGSVVTLLLKGRYVYAGHAGHVTRLTARDGSIGWTNNLPKMGYHPVTLAMAGAVGGSATVPAAVAAQQRQHAAAT